MLLADFAGLAIDHAGRLSGSEAKRASLQQTVDALDATIQIARALGGETDLNAILALVAKRGRALVSARTLIIELLSGGELELAAGAGAAGRGEPRHQLRRPFAATTSDNEVSSHYRCRCVATTDADASGCAYGVPTCPRIQWIARLRCRRVRPRRPMRPPTSRSRSSWLTITGWSARD
jgi:hypothetical protein